MNREELLAELANQKKAAKYWMAEAKREQRNVARLTDLLRSIRASITKQIGN